MIPAATLLNIPFPAAPRRTWGRFAVGPDNNLWILENIAQSAVAKVSTAGALLAEYPVLFENYPQGLKAGSDGAMWITQEYPNNVIRMTTSGIVSYVPLTTVNADGNDLAFGPDGKIWVAELQAGAIGRMSAIGGQGKNIVLRRGVSGGGNIATFTDGTPSAVASDFTAIIDWGDGTLSPGNISGVTGGPFNVSGNHRYLRSGLYKLEVYLNDRVDNSTYASSSGEARVF